MLSRLCLSLLFVVITTIELSTTSLPAAQADSGGQTGFTPADEAAVLAQALAHGDPRIRQAAEERLAEMGADAIPALRTALHRSDPHVYQPAARVLGVLRERGLPVLIEGLTSKNLLTRVKAADAIHSMRMQAVPALCDALRHGTWTGRTDAGDCGPEIAQEIAFASRFSSQPDPMLQQDFEQADLRREVADVLGDIGEEIQEASGMSRGVDSAVAADLLKGFAPAISALVEALHDDHEPVRVAASRALQRTGVSTVPALVEVLTSDNAMARYAATQILGDFGKEIVAITPALATAAQDQDLSVRTAALEALCASTIPLVRTEASRALDGVYRDTVTAGIDAVAQVIAGPAAEIVPVLDEAVTDPDRRVRFLGVVAAGRYGKVAAGAEKLVAGANADDLVKKACDDVVAKATTTDRTLSDEAKAALSASTEAALREAWEKAVQESVEGNRLVREAAEQALQIAAEDPDLVVRVAAANALRKMAR